MFDKSLKECLESLVGKTIRDIDVGDETIPNDPDKVTSLELFFDDNESLEIIDGGVDGVHIEYYKDGRLVDANYKCDEDHDFIEWIFRNCDITYWADPNSNDPAVKKALQYRLSSKPIPYQTECTSPNRATLNNIFGFCPKHKVNVVDWLFDNCHIVYKPKPHGSALLHYIEHKTIFGCYKNCREAITNVYERSKNEISPSLSKMINELGEEEND